MPSLALNNRRVAIIGAGPAGLMAATVLAQAGVRVQVFEHKASAGRKFLMAGKGGLNISHSEPLLQFLARYTPAKHMQPFLELFNAEHVRRWMKSLGIDSYIGSSGRIFPTDMKAAPLLRQWLIQLKQQQVEFFYRWRWLGWQDNPQAELSQTGLQIFKDAQGTEHRLAFDAVILAVGGGSWARLGSDGQAISWLAERVEVEALQPSNGGVNIAWSKHLQALAGQPLKRVAGYVDGETQVKPLQREGLKSEAVITPYGLEGSLIYALSQPIRRALEHQQHAQLWLDLLPDISYQTLIARLLKAQKTSDSLTNQWRKAGLDNVKSALIREVLSRHDWTHLDKVTQTVKALPLTVTGLQPIDEAISTAGGVAFSSLGANLMFRQYPGVFCCGEMLAWDAPTGGYLLTACLATGHAAGLGALDYLKKMA